jgi:hyperosmotically inducible periplasmic protein
VNKGAVVLTGSADNMAQKELTEVYVKEVEGVKSVTNDLVVKSPPPEGNSHTVGEAIDDASITSQVKYSLLTHRSTSALKTTVTTKNGVVMIGGEAQSDAERDLVTKLASSIRGVQSVENNMTVKMN